MINQSALDLFNILMERWNKAVTEKRFDDAAHVAIAAHLALQEMKEPAFEHLGLSWLELLSKQAQSGSGNSGIVPTQNDADVCLFCMQKRSAQEIILGAKAQICKTCVRNIVNKLP
jgi:hypothetical protein